MAQSTPVLLEVTELTKRFGGLYANRNVSLNVHTGEILGLIGPNGAGKSVFFGGISGIHKVTSGHVQLDGESITNLPAHVICEKGIGRTFQGSRVFKSLTALENVMVGQHCRTAGCVPGAWVMNRRWRRENRQAETAALAGLEEVGLGLVERKKTLAKDLTYVMQAFVGIATALVTKPKLLLLDEPMAGMNLSEIAETMELLYKLRETGIAIFIVEHHMKAIMGVCDRIIVLSAGEKLTEGTPSEVSQNPEVIEAYLGRGYGRDANA